MCGKILGEGWLNQHNHDLNRSTDTVTFPNSQKHETNVMHTQDANAIITAAVIS